MIWSNWENLENLPDTESKGVYRVRIVCNKEKPISIQRFLDEDKDGIIMIGKTDNMKRRLNQLYKIVIEKKKYPHSEGWSLLFLSLIPKFNEKYGIKYGICTFEYSFSKTDNPTEQEKTLLKNYFLDYGELPPLNYKREFISSKKIKELYFSTLDYQKNLNMGE